MTNKKVKQFLIQETFNKWAKENKDFIDDLLNLIWQGQMFKIKYGVGLEIKSVPLEKLSGRDLGIGEVFDIQKFVNKQFKNKKSNIP